MLVEQKHEVDRLGKLGSAGVVGVEAEPAVFGVELLRRAWRGRRRADCRDRASFRWPLAALSRLRAASVTASASFSISSCCLRQALGDLVDDGQEPRGCPRGRAAENRSRRRTAGRRASGTATSASRPRPNAWSAAM